MIEIYGCRLMDSNRFLEIKNLILEYLPEASREKINRYKSPVDQQRKMIGEMLVRSVTASKLKLNSHDIHFYYSEKNKPLLLDLDTLHFNISHSGDWVVAAFSEQPVGVDVEKVRKMNSGVARRFFSEEEVAALTRLPLSRQTDLFFELWTCKESYLKAIGTGLTRALNSFTVRHEDHGIGLYEENRRVNVYLQQFTLDRSHKLAVCGYEDEICRDVRRLFVDDLIGRSL
ncbi:MAG: 4'-phosphopantetheinyl transferase family protein [Bacteroidota bacterium]